MRQLTLEIAEGIAFTPPRNDEASHPGRLAPAFDLHGYDYYLVAFSGGKDSVAAVLDLKERGVAMERVELWHHEVDGREGSRLMDWPCTPAYCRAFAAAFQLPFYASWRTGGFEREMLRKNSHTAPVQFEAPGGQVVQVGANGGKRGTRLRFLQVSADLTVRWCSAYLKIDVMAAAIRNQERFQGKRTLVISGERAEESPCRARYATFEPHRADRRRSEKLSRHIDHHRPVHGWSEAEVWALLERHRVNPHPAYRLGWGRVSCAACIFGGPDQWASLRTVNPRRFSQIATYERQFGWTIRRGESIIEAADRGQPYPMLSQADIAAALDEEWREPIVLPPEQRWKLPAGAFGDSPGPT